MTFQFDPKTHTYTLDGKRLSSITKILKSMGFLTTNAGSELETEAAMSRGRSVHKACWYSDENDLNWKTVAHSIKGYVMAYQYFVEDFGMEWFLIEEPLYDPTLWFAGTPDRMGLMKKKGYYAIVEIKTGAIEPWHALQTAAHEHLIRLKLGYENFDFVRCAVQLNPDGTYEQPHYFLDPNDLYLWRSIVSLYHWKRNNGYQIGENDHVNTNGRKDLNPSFAEAKS